MAHFISLLFVLVGFGFSYMFVVVVFSCCCLILFFSCLCYRSKLNSG